MATPCCGERVGFPAAARARPGLPRRCAPRSDGLRPRPVRHRRDGRRVLPGLRPGAAATPGARAPRTVIARRRSRRGNPEVLRFAWSMWRKMARGGDWIAASAAPPRNDQRAGVCRLPDETLSKSDSGTQPLRCLGCICFILRATPRQAIEDRLLAETLREGELKQVV